jgi:hypothetical protein
LEKERGHAKSFIYDGTGHHNARITFRPTNIRTYTDAEEGC